MNKIIIALPYCSSDHTNATRLLNWIAELDHKVDHHLLLVADNAVPMETKKALDALGKSVFTSAETITPQCPAVVNGNYHPAAAVMFERTAAHIDACYKWNWLWMEPDCVPLKPGWANALADAYEQCPKRFMGAVTKVNQENLPKVVMFATAMYPNCAHPDLKKFCDGKAAFDMAFSDYVVPRAQNTNLIFHRFGSPTNPPTFKEVKMPGDGANVGTLDMIPQEAVLFHRVKDSSLIDLIRNRMNGVPPTPQFVSVQPIQETSQEAPQEPIKRGPGRPKKIQPLEGQMP